MVYVTDLFQPTARWFRHCVIAICFCCGHISDANLSRNWRIGNELLEGKIQCKRSNNDHCSKTHERARKMSGCGNSSQLSITYRPFIAQKSEIAPSGPLLAASKRWKSASLCPSENQSHLSCPIEAATGMRIMDLTMVEKIERIELMETLNPRL